MGAQSLIGHEGAHFFGFFLQPGLQLKLLLFSVRTQEPPKAEMRLNWVGTNDSSTLSFTSNGVFYVIATLPLEFIAKLSVMILVAPFKRVPTFLHLQATLLY
jgi:hypothetical protein